MSDDTTPQIQVQVDVVANAAPAQQVADSLGAVKTAAGAASDATDKHTTAMDKMGQGAMDAGHVLRGLEAASHGSARGLFAAAQGARHLMESLGMGALGPLALFIGGITAGVMGLIKLFQDSKEEAAKLSDESAKLAIETRKLIDLRLQARIDEYAQMSKNIDAAATAQERFNAARIKSLEASTAVALAKVDLQESQDILKLNPADKTGRERIRLSAAQSRLDIQNSAEANKADLEVRGAQDKATAARDSAERVLREAEQQQKINDRLIEEDDLRKSINAQLAQIEQSLQAAKAKPTAERTMADYQRIFVGESLQRDLRAKLAPMGPQEDFEARIAEADKKMMALQAQYEEKASAARLADVETTPPKLRAQEVRLRGQAHSNRQASDVTQFEYDEQQRAAEAARTRQRADIEAEKERLVEIARQTKEKQMRFKQHEAPEQAAAVHAMAHAQDEQSNAQKSRGSRSHANQDMASAMALQHEVEQMPSNLEKYHESVQAQIKGLNDQLKSLAEKNSNNLTN
jgi:hypothetical protein